MINELLLLSKNDIPLLSSQLNMHQPTLKEIAYLGEENFFAGIQFFNISKNDVSEDVDLSEYDDFDIILMIAADKNPVVQKTKAQAEMVLSLLFPEYHIMFSKQAIVLLRENDKSTCSIDSKGFVEFKEALNEMFCIASIFGNHAVQEYNPDGAVAKKLADKFKERRKKLNELKNQDKKEGQKVTILSRYLSILTVGEQKDMNSFLEYSVYQLFDEFERFTLKQQSDMYIQAKMAGAENLKEVDNWMGDIHSKSNE